MKPPLQPPPLPSAPDKDGADDPAEIESPHRSEADLESPDNPKDVNWQFIGVVVAIIGVVVVIIFGSLDYKSSRETTEALEKIAEITAELVDQNPNEATETAERVQRDPAASLIDRTIAAAVLFQQQGKIEEAIKKWRFITNVAGEENRQLRADAWFSIGYLRSVGKGADMEAAIYAYTRVIELEPDDVAAYTNRGTAKDNLGRHRAAIADFDRAIELEPGATIAYTNRGNVKRDLGQYQAAIVDHDRAIELEPNFSVAYYNRGNVKGDLDLISEAKEDYRRALVLAQEAGDAHIVEAVEHSLRIFNNEGP